MNKKSDQCRRTPLWLFKWLDQQFGPFELDAAADKDNALCDFMYDEKHDALKPDNEWMSKNFCNPPFKKMGGWVQKAIDECKSRGAFTLMLAPQGGSQDWYHDLARQYTILAPNMRINYDDRHGNPTGGRHGESGADRDTTILLIGPGFENPDHEKGFFRLVTLDLKAVPRE